MDELRECPFCKSYRVVHVRHDSDWGSGNSVGLVNPEKYYKEDVDYSADGEANYGDVNIFACLKCGEVWDNKFSDKTWTPIESKVQTKLPDPRLNKAVEEIEKQKEDVFSDDQNKMERNEIYENIGERNAYKLCVATLYEHLPELVNCQQTHSTDELTNEDNGRQ